MRIVSVTLSGIERVKETVTAFKWKCDVCGKPLKMYNERALLKLIERHQGKDSRDRELREKFREIKAHVSGRREVSE